MQVGIVAAALVLALASTAQAGTLVTAPLRVSSGQQVNPSELNCTIVNASNVPVTVTITSRFREQEPLVQGPFVLQPGEADALRDLNDASLTRVGYCSFEVKGRNDRVRAAACVTDSNLDCMGAVPAF